MQLFFAEHMFQDKMEEGRHRVGREGGGEFGNCSVLVAKILTGESLEGGKGRLGASWSKIPREKCILVINQT